MSKHYSYGPYGQTQALGADSTNNQQYTGREAGVEGEAGLYYYRARYYDPVVIYLFTTVFFIYLAS